MPRPLTLRQALGLELRARRDSLGVTQAALSRALRMSQSSLSRMEAGIYPVSVEVLADACRYLHVAPAVIVRAAERRMK